MTARTPTALKLFFQTGDRPSQSNFGDVMDSYVNVVQTSGQSIVSDVSALGTLDVSGSAAFKSNVSVSGNLSVVGNVSANGNISVNGTFSIAALSATTLSVTGNSTLGGVTVSADTGFIKPTGIRGTTTNNSAAAGIVGEIITSNVGAGSAVSLSSSVSTNVTSILLTPGDWDVDGTVAYQTTGSISAVNAAVGTTSASFPSLYTTMQVSFNGTLVTIMCPTTQVSISINTTVYLLANAGFTSACSAYGNIRARRVR